MHSAIERSCNTYFWAMGLITDPEQTTEMVNYLGYGQKFDLPIPSQRFGTMPNPKWLEKKYHREVAGLRFAPTRRSARAMCSSIRCSWRSCRRGSRPGNCSSRGC